MRELSHEPVRLVREPYQRQHFGGDIGGGLAVKAPTLSGLFTFAAVASLGLLLIAALYATHARTGGPVAALHAAGLVLIAIAAAGALGALGLPSLRNAALEY